MKDHYEQFTGISSRLTGPLSTPVAVKLKRKKITSENLMISNGDTKNHYLDIFKSDSLNIESMMQNLDQLNQNCNENDKELTHVN